MIMTKPNKIALDWLSALMSPLAIWSMLGKKWKTLKIRKILIRRNVSKMDILPKLLSIKNVTIEGNDISTKTKSNLFQPSFQYLLKLNVLILIIISKTKNNVQNKSMYDNMLLLKPDSVMKIIIVLIIIMDNTIVSLRNTFLKLVNI